MQAILGADVPAYSLAVWHGLTAPLIMSLIALAGGAALYALLYFRWDAGAAAGAVLRIASTASATSRWSSSA